MVLKHMGMETILYFAPESLSDAVMASGALNAARARAPDARLTLVANAETVDLLRAFNAAEVAQGAGAGEFSGWLGLWRRLGARRFDLIIDACGAPISGFLSARTRWRWRRPAALAHRVEQYSQMAGARALAPLVMIDDSARAGADAAISGPVLALAPAARTPERAWPAESYAAAARRLASGLGPLNGVSVALIGRERDRARAAAIARSLDADGVASVNLAGRLDILATAALLERAVLFIGEDSAFMHIAAASGAPTLGLFGPSDERVAGPWGPRARAVRARPYEDVMALAREAGARLMNEVTVDAVEAAANDLLRAGGVR